MKTKQVTAADLIAARSERDTYRELCEELLNEMKTAVVYSENNIGSIGHLKAAITKAEAILGDKNANS